MTTIVVPTFNVACVAAVNIVGSNGETIEAGGMIKLPYGVALQGMATGTIAAIVAGAAAHAKAMEFVEQYGADSWFHPPMQTISRLEAAMNAEPETKVLLP